MSRFIIRVLVALVCAAPAWADYTTPNIGMVYSMDDLVTQSGGAVTGNAGSYQVHESVILSPNDALELAPGEQITFMGTDGDVGLEVNGRLAALGSEEAPIILTGDAATPGCWRGLDYRNQGPASGFHLSHVTIAYAEIAVDVYGGEITLENSDIRHCLKKALDFSQAGGLVSDCHIHHNQQRTITITLDSSPTIRRCVLDNNNLENSSPYPYINVGLQGNNSPIIEGCTITGDGNEMSGGMAFWALSQAQVIDNSISGCGFGILCYDTGANPLIQGNRIFDNTIHPDTVNWGFGVACNGNNAPTLVRNQIHGHWYGVAAINGGRPNLGNLDNDDPGDDGGNRLADNGINGQLYAFYNNTPLPQMAQGNAWGTDTPADVIWDQADNPNLGPVNWDYPILATPAHDTPAADHLARLQAYPNPFNPMVQIKLEMNQPAVARVVVMDAAGHVVRRLHDGLLPAGATVLPWNGYDSQGRAAASGVYWFRAETPTGRRTAKAVLVR